jgi:hypothetical protein
MDELPDTAALTVREIDHVGHVFQFSAAHATGAAGWVARPTRYSLTLDALDLQRRLVDEPSGGEHPVATTRLFSTTADAMLLVEAGEPVGPGS